MAASNATQLEIKTLHGKKVVWDGIDADTLTIEELYRRVHTIEKTPDGKWKLMMVSPTLKTLKWSDKDRTLSSVGIKAAANNGACRIEVVLDMGACHTTCKRLETTSDK